MENEQPSGAKRESGKPYSEMTEEEVDKECIEAMNGHYTQLKQESEKDRISNNRILKLVKLIKGEKWFRDLESYMIDSAEYHGRFTIVEKPCGKYQREAFKYLKGVWVNQYSGYACDDYFGTVCVKIRRGKYLKMNYQC